MRVFRLTAVLAIAMIAAAATPPPAAASPPTPRAAPTAPPVQQLAIVSLTRVSGLYTLALQPASGIERSVVAVSRTVSRDAIAPPADVLLAFDRHGGWNQRPATARFHARHSITNRMRSRAGPLTNGRRYRQRLST